MKSWCDLSWREKCRIKSGGVNSLSYQSGYDFRVKAKVQEGLNKVKLSRDDDQLI